MLGKESELLRQNNRGWINAGVEIPTMHDLIMKIEKDAWRWYIWLVWTVALEWSGIMPSIATPAGTKLRFQFGIHQAAEKKCPFWCRF